VRELVDQHDLRPAGEHRVEVELVEVAAAVGHRAARHGLQALEQAVGLRPLVGLDQADHDVGAAFEPAVRLAEHGERLADARRRAEVDAQLTAAGFVPPR
jgi:hypothetical protein